MEKYLLGLKAQHVQRMLNITADWLSHKDIDHRMVTQSSNLPRNNAAIRHTYHGPVRDIVQQASTPVPVSVRGQGSGRSRYPTSSLTKGSALCFSSTTTSQQGVGKTTKGKS